MDIITWIVAAAVGAGVMYLLDPQQGGRRRRDVANKLPFTKKPEKLTDKVASQIGDMGHKVQDKVQDAVAQAQSALKQHK
jgi:hypothetical protein